MSLPTRLACALAATVLLAAACDRSPTSADRSRPADAPLLATNVSVVCSLQSVPTGYVILYYTSSSGCPYYSSTNAKVIGLPSSPETACSNSSVPSGWVVTSYGQNPSCLYYSALSFNTFTIRIPGYQETVCYNSPVPSNYQVIYYGWSGSCPNYSTGTNNTKTIQRI